MITENDFLKYMELHERLEARIRDLAQKMREYMYPWVGSLENYWFPEGKEGYIKGYIIFEFERHTGCGCCHDIFQTEVPVSHLWMKDEEWMVFEKVAIATAEEWKKAEAERQREKTQKELLAQEEKDKQEYERLRKKLGEK